MIAPCRKQLHIRNKLQCKKIKIVISTAIHNEKCEVNPMTRGVAASIKVILHKLRGLAASLHAHDLARACVHSLQERPISLREFFFFSAWMLWLDRM